MKKVAILISLILFGFVSHGHSFKDSCRCNHRIVETGFTRAQVIRLCGEPTTSTSDMLVYDLGPNRLIRIFHFYHGRLVKIEYGGRGSTTPYHDPSVDLEALSSVNLIRLSTYMKDGTLSIGLLYKNREMDKLVFWKGNRVTCDYRVYEGTGSILEPTKGDLIDSGTKILHRYDQHFYVDIPNIYLGKDKFLIIKCKVDTGQERLLASDICIAY